MRQVLSVRSTERPLFYGLLAVTFVSATAIVAYHAHSGAAVIGGLAYTSCFAICSAWLLSGSFGPNVRRAISNPALWFVVLLALAAIDQRHYRQASVLPTFASSAEALERPARLLLHGEEPYRYFIGGIPVGENLPTTDAQTPISPGPGWVILLSPLTAPLMTGLVAMVFVGIALAVLERRDRLVAGAFLLLLLAQPIFFFQAENGQDLYVISIALVVIALLADRSLSTVRTAIVIGVLSGFIATSRVPMLLPVAVIGLGCFRKNRRTGSVFLLVSLLTALGLHGVFAIWAHHYGHFYQPMHVFHRGSSGAGLSSRISAIVLLCLALLWVYWKMRDDVASWCTGAFLVMICLFTPEALKELAYARALNWEGSTYITFPVPLLIAAVVLRASDALHQTVPDAKTSSALTTSSLAS